MQKYWLVRSCFKSHISTRIFSNISLSLSFSVFFSAFLLSHKSLSTAEKLSSTSLRLSLLWRALFCFVLFFFFALHFLSSRCRSISVTLLSFFLSREKLAITSPLSAWNEWQRHKLPQMLLLQYIEQQKLGFESTYCQKAELRRGEKSPYRSELDLEGD